MGRFYFLRSHYDRAEPLLLETVDHPRFSFSSWLLLAKISFLHGRVDHGRHRLLRALAANPKKFAKLRKRWAALSPLWMLEQGPRDSLQAPPSSIRSWDQTNSPGFCGLPLFVQEEQESQPEQDPQAEQEFGVLSAFDIAGFEENDLFPASECQAIDDAMDDPCENRDGLFHFGISDAEFEEFLFGDHSDDEDEDEEEEEEEDEGLNNPNFSGEAEGTWNFSGSWDADWGGFLSEELFSSLSDEDLPEDKEDCERGFRDPQESGERNEAQSQYWERFLKNPEFLDPKEARKFGLLPPIHHSEFRNLDWTYLQSRLFPKGGKTEGRS